MLSAKHRLKPKRLKLDLIKRLTSNYFDIDEEQVDNCMMLNYVRHVLTDYPKCCTKDVPDGMSWERFREHVNSKILRVYPELR